MKSIALLTGLCLIAGCSYSPPGIRPVDHFEIERYLGTWHEIARLDHHFERGLSRVSAHYTKRPDGGIDVLNRGYDSQKERWKKAKGRAYFTGDPEVAQLRVTFFWPFYAGYNLIDIDRENYSYALVCGPDRKYLWILSRTKKLDDEIVQRLVATARRLNFATNNLIFVEQ